MFDFENVPDLLGTLIPLIISMIAVSISIFSTKRSEDVLTYNSLDKIYTELMKVGIDNPDFRDPQKTNNYKNSFDGDRVYAYESYAFMAINLIATIHDRYKKTPDTWRNIISHEINLHKDWFADNSVKFKSEFIGFVEQIINSKNTK